MRCLRYIIYQTRNLVNGKIYVGAHVTLDPMDDYLGSGRLLQRAIRKYGRESFRKTIIEEFTSFEAMMAKEIEIVDAAFVRRNDTYNATVGGKGTWGRSGETFASLGPKRTEWLWKNDKLWRERQTVRLRKTHFGHGQPNPAQGKGWFNRGGQNRLFALEDSCMLIADGWARGRLIPEHVSAALQAKRGTVPSGKGNPMFGRIWVTNKNLRQSRAISPDQLNTYLNDGWEKGRRMFA